MSRERIVGTALLATGLAGYVCMPGLVDTYISYELGVSKQQAIARLEMIKMLNPLGYALISPGTLIGMKLFYKE